MDTGHESTGFTIAATHDGPQVRYRGVALPYIDAATFVAIGGAYGRDRRFAYWQGQIIDDCCPERLRHLRDGYATDGERIYLHGSAIPVDPESFAPLAHAYARDATGVFIYGRPIPGADPATATVLGEHYLRDAHAIYHLEHPVEGADHASFTVLGQRYARDRDGFFCNGQRLTAVDRASFRIISDVSGSPGYAADAHRVYHDAAIITDADPERFEVLPWFYARDGAHVYHFGYRVEAADAASFRTLEAEGFGVDHAAIFFRQHRVAPLVADFAVIAPLTRDRVQFEPAVYYRYDGAIHALADEGFSGLHHRLNADPRTFVHLGGSYACDAQTVFYHGTVVQGCDPAGFRDLGLGYCRDDGSVFYDGQRLSGADAATFAIGPAGWSHDRHRVYLEAEPVQGLTAEGFTIISSQFVRDRHAVFHHDARMMILLPVAGADPGSFAVIEGVYARDRERVYVAEEPIPGADPDTFAVIGYGWSRDERRLYYQARLVECADPASFQVLDDRIAIDDRHFYHYGEAQACDRASFTIVDAFFCKDRTRVWFGSEPQPGIDAPSFTRMTPFYYVDRHRVYERETPLPVAPEHATFPHAAYLVASQAVYFLASPLPGADPASFEVLANNFSKDAGHVYFRDQVIDGADASTFTVTNYLEACDRHRVYSIRGGQVVVLRSR
ncbi:MAG: DKNYY domain-containing protein [Planctomycetota bacterium]